MDLDSDGRTDYLLVAAPMFYSQGWEKGRVYIYALTSEVWTGLIRFFYSVACLRRWQTKLSPQTSLVLQGLLEVSDQSQNSRLGSAMTQIADMNGDGLQELVVGAPLEDDHQGAVYIFHSKDKKIQPPYKQVTV